MVLTFQKQRTLVNKQGRAGRDPLAFRGRRFKALPQPTGKVRDVSDLSIPSANVLRSLLTGSVRWQYLDEGTGELVTLYNADNSLNDVATRGQQRRVDYADRTRDAQRRRTALYKTPKRVDTMEFLDDLTLPSEHITPAERYRLAVKQRDYNTYLKYANNPYGAARDYVSDGLRLEEGQVPQRFQLQATRRDPSPRAQLRDKRAAQRSQDARARQDTIMALPIPEDQAAELRYADKNSFGVYSTKVTNRNMAKLVKRGIADYAHVREVHGDVLNPAYAEMGLDPQPARRAELGARVERSHVDARGVVVDAHYAPRAAASWKKDDSMAIAAGHVDASHVARGAAADDALGRAAHPRTTQRRVEQGMAPGYSALHAGALRAAVGDAAYSATPGVPRKDDDAPSVSETARRHVNPDVVAGCTAVDGAPLDVAMQRGQERGLRHERLHPDASLARGVNAYDPVQAPERGLERGMRVDGAAAVDSAALHPAAAPREYGAATQARAEQGFRASSGVLHAPSMDAGVTGADNVHVPRAKPHMRDDMHLQRAASMREMPRLSFQYSSMFREKPVVDELPTLQSAQVTRSAPMDTPHYAKEALLLPSEPPRPRTWDVLSLS